jgi:hypothetical protein
MTTGTPWIAYALKGFFESGRHSAFCAEATPAWCRVTVADRPHHLRWLELADDRVAVAVQFCLNPDETGGTVLTHTRMVIEPEALRR